MWERDERGIFIYKNFRAVKESKIFPFIGREIIRPKLKDFCHINFYNLRKFALLLYNPNLVYELYDACKLMGYYDSEKIARDAKLQRFIDSISRTNEFWSIFSNKKFIDAAKKSFSKLGVGIVDWSLNEQEGKSIFRLRESISTPIKSSTLCCPEQIGDFAGALESFSYRFWSGTETKCKSRGDDYCQFDMYITKKKETPKINTIDKTNIEKILDDLVYQLHKDEKRIYRKTLGDYVHISGEQCINYILISKSLGHRLLAKHSGNIVGQKVVKGEELKTEREVLEYLTDIFEYFRVGILDKPQYVGDIVKIQMHESVYSSGVEDMNQTLDVFISGIIEGALKQITNQNWFVEETKCLASGDEYCEFTCKIR